MQTEEKSPELVMSLAFPEIPEKDPRKRFSEVQADFVRIPRCLSEEKSKDILLRPLENASNKGSGKKSPGNA